MVVHHVDGLHIRVDGRRADKHEAALLEVFAKCFGLWRHGWYRGSSMIRPENNDRGRNLSPKTVPHLSTLRLRWHPTLLERLAHASHLPISAHQRLSRSALSLPPAVS